MFRKEESDFLIWVLEPLREEFGTDIDFLIDKIVALTEQKQRRNKYVG